MPSKPPPRKTRAAMALWRRDPVAWIRDWMGIDLTAEPWDHPDQRAYQAEIVTSIAENQETFVVTGHSVGKDFLAGRVVPWWICTRKGVVLTTAVKALQVEKILWGEVRSAYKSALAPLGGRLMPAAARWDGTGPKHYALGMTANEVNALAGFHADNVLGLVDEAAGVPDFAQEALMGCAVGADDRLAYFGNPKCGPTHWFAKDASSPDIPGRKKTIRVRGDESPNVVQGRVVIKGLQTVEGIDRIARKHPPGSLIYNAMVGAKFPTSGSDSLIGYEHINRARYRLEVGAKPRDQDLPKMGCDVARYGEDLTVIAYVHGPLAGFPHDGTVAKASNVKVARRILTVGAAIRAEAVAIDGGGLGSGPVDMLKELRREMGVPSHFRVLDVQFGGKARDAEKFADRRTEMWWNMREWLWDYGAIDPDPELEEELLAPTYGYVRQRIKLEPKDKIKERIGRSPDRADALALAITAQRIKSRRRGGGEASRARKAKPQTKRYGEIPRADSRRVLG